MPFSAALATVATVVRLKVGGIPQKVPRPKGYSQRIHGAGIFTYIGIILNYFWGSM